jgi:hypothetical protein
VGTRCRFDQCIPFSCFWYQPTLLSPLLTQAFLFVWTQDLPAENVASETKTSPSEPDKPPRAFNEFEDPASIKRSNGSEESAETQRKASLKEKISGGAKIVSGKLGRDKSKVEEGKKLMQGQGT